MKKETTTTIIASASIAVAILIMAVTRPRQTAVFTPETEAMPTAVQQMNVETHEDSVMRLACAVAWVESRWNPEAVNGSCVGYLQISPVMVREANRIVGWECFDNNDRWDEQGSLAIFHVVMDRHNPTLDVARACSIWNGRAVSQMYINLVKYKLRQLEADGWNEAVDNNDETPF